MKPRNPVLVRSATEPIFSLEYSTPTPKLNSTPTSDSRATRNAGPPERKATMEIEHSFDKRETATLLHALRLFQDERAYGNNPTCNTRQGCDHFADTTPLEDDEIDLLCERLNLGAEEDKPATSPDTTPTCKHCAGEIEKDDAGDWIHANGFYGCTVSNSDISIALTCAEVDEPA